MFLGLIFGLANNIISTHLLSERDYGFFRLLQMSWLLGIVVLGFGYFSTVGLKILNNKTDVQLKRDVFNGGCVLAFLMGSLLLIATGAAHYFGLWSLNIPTSDNILPYYCLIVSAFSLLFVPYSALIQEYCRSTGSIFWLCTISIAPPVLFLLVITSFITVIEWNFNANITIIDFVLAGNFRFDLKLDFVFVLCAYLSSQMIPAFIFILSEQAWRGRMFKGLGIIFSNNKHLGFNVYQASVLGSTTSQFGAFAVAHFSGAESAGKFALAQTITNPLMLFPNALANTRYREFSEAEQFPLHVLKLAIIVVALSFAIFCLIIDPIVTFAFPSSYKDVVILSLISGFGASLHGIGDLLNRFLLAHGKVSVLRNSAFIVFVFTIISYISLNYYYGVIGAVIAKVIIDLVYILTMAIYQPKKPSIKDSI